MKPEAAGRFWNRDEIARGGLREGICDYGHFVPSRLARGLPKLDRQAFLVRNVGV